MSSSPERFTFHSVNSNPEPQPEQENSQSSAKNRRSSKKRSKQNEDQNNYSLPAISTTPNHQRSSPSANHLHHHRQNSSSSLPSILHRQTNASPPSSNMIVIDANEDHHQQHGDGGETREQQHQQPDKIIYKEDQHQPISPFVASTNFSATNRTATSSHSANISIHHHHPTANRNITSSTKQRKMMMLPTASTPQPHSSSSHPHQKHASSKHHHHQQRIFDEESYRFMSKTPELDPYVREHHFAAAQQNHQRKQFSNNNQNQNAENDFNFSSFNSTSNGQQNSNQQQPLGTSVSKMISENQFSADEFYVLRLLVSGQSMKTQKLPLQIPHVDLSWMKSLFKTKDGNPPSRNEVERTLTECARKNILTLNLDCLADDARDFGPDALTPILINSPRSAIVLLRNGISVTKMLARPPAFYATDKKGSSTTLKRGSSSSSGVNNSKSLLNNNSSSINSIGRRSPDRLLLHLRKQRADEVRSHLVASITSQYKQLCRNISPVDAILACCPPKQDDPDVIVEEQLAKEMEQLEKLKNRTTMAVSRSVREQRDLEEKVAARQQRSEVCELLCRERMNARVESLKDRAEKRAEKLRDLRARAEYQTKEMQDQFREVEMIREEKQQKFRDKQREDQELKHLHTMRKLREAQDAHHLAEVVKKRKREAKVVAKSEKIADIRDEKDAENELRKLDFVELERAREEVKDRARESVLEFRRRAAQKVIAAAQQADEAELRLARKRNRRKAIGEFEHEKRQEVIEKARKMFERKQARLETKYSEAQIEQAERAMVRAEVARVNAVERAAENAERMDAHDMSSQQQAFQKLLVVASLARKEDAANVHAQRKKMMDESGQWIRDVARHHFEEQRKRITEMVKQQHRQ